MNSMNVKKKLLCTAIMTLSGSLAMQSSAQSMLEEIVVTAQKREQNLQDVGIAVTAFPVNSSVHST